VRQRDKTLILGDFRTGKTTLARTLLARSPRYLAWDPTWVLVDDAAHDVPTLADHQRRLGRGILQPEDEDASFDAFCELAFRSSNTLVFIDEPADRMDARAPLPADFARLLRRGHKYGNGLVLATHRYHGDLPAITRTCENLFAFRCSVDVDLVALKDMIGDEGAAWVRTAPRWHFWARRVTDLGVEQGPCPPVRPARLKYP